MSTKSEKKEENDQLKVMLESGHHIDPAVAKNLIGRGMFAHEKQPGSENLLNFLGQRKSSRHG
jgi:hypothetical protein